MKKNIGPKDKKIRLGIALVLVILLLLGVFPAGWGVPVGVVAVALVVTSLIGVCGMYSLFGVTTCPVSSSSSPLSPSEKDLQG